MHPSILYILHTQTLIAKLTTFVGVLNLFSVVYLLIWIITLICFIMACDMFNVIFVTHWFCTNQTQITGQSASLFFVTLCMSNTLFQYFRTIQTNIFVCYTHMFYCFYLSIKLLMMWTPLEGEHLHPYALGPVPEDERHGKEQIYTGTKDLDCTGVSQNRQRHAVRRQ